MSTNRVAIVEAQLDDYLAGARAAEVQLAPGDPLRAGSRLTARKAIELFEDQYASRAIDVAARELKRDGRSFYTISSAGHEQDAVVGAQLTTGDPCFLHYRSGGLMMARARRAGGSTPIFDTLLGICASSDDPVCQGRHKVWGSRRLWVPPQTSTIASHLPKALGLAFALSRARRLKLETGLANDAIVLCSFGDASVNHATALAGINSARYAWRGGRPTPILFLCEDNRVGISTQKPSRWIGDFFGNMRHLQYFVADGEVDEVWDTVELAIRTCRGTRSPVFLRLPCVRLWGHAGSDVETTYHTLQEIEAVEASDPLLANARRLVETGAARPEELAAIVKNTRERVHHAAEEAAARPRLTSVPEIVRPLAPYDEPKIRAAALAAPAPEARAENFGGRLPETLESPTQRTMAARINAALHDAMLTNPEILVFGEDVGRKGGVYGITANLQKRFGPARVFDTLLDETTILGVAQGAAHIGFLPIPEIQYLAYVHNALDQIRGEACSLSFFSNGQFTNPMVVRIASFAYQRGFGGHFHNDHSIGALRDIPGLAIAAPSRGDDAARLLRGAVAMAKACGRVVAFLEPIALYHERDLHEPGDGGWLSDYPAPGTDDSVLLPGEIGVHGDGRDLAIVSYANGLRLSLRAQRILRDEHGIDARVLDLRWLNPLPTEAVREQAAECAAVLVADECRATGGGIADAVLAGLVEARFEGRAGSVRAVDTYVPLGPASEAVLMSTEDIVEGARRLVS